jgi:ureidoacrylate peracid hydrolase
MLDQDLRPDRAALLLLDLQNGFLDPDGPFTRGGLIATVADRPEMVANILAAVAATRAAGRPVVFVNTAFRSDRSDCYLSETWRECLQSAEPDAFVEGSKSAAVIDEVVPRAEDLVIVKKSHSAFQFTHLDRALADLGVDTCLLAGNLSSGMEETVRQGAALGYENVLFTDASFPMRSPLLETLKRRTFQATTSEVLTWFTPSIAPATDVGIHPCLLVVDIQNDFIHPDGANSQGLSEDDRAQILGNNQRLIEHMRTRGFPVIYVKSERGQDRFVDTASARMALRTNATEYHTEGTWGAEIVDAIAPTPGDYVIRKRGHSAFGTTHLHRMLRNLGVNSIVVTGGSVVGCVADSSREGIGLGYEVSLVGDATYPPRKREIAYASLASRLQIRSTDETLRFLEGAGAGAAGATAPR